MTNILNIVPDDNYRIIVISDIHGGNDLFEKLLMKCNLKDNDYLVILGDFLQRGYYNTQMLNRVMELSGRANTFILSGNHENYLCSLLKEDNIKKFKYHQEIINYGCILKDWIEAAELNTTDCVELQNSINRIYKSKIDFLNNLPHAIEIGEHIFAHAGIEEIEDWKDSEIKSLLSIPEFYLKTHKSNKHVVVGHWPIQNYHEKSLSGDIIFDEKKKIIAIDGGYGVKSTGQINALIIDKKTSVTYEKVSVDSFRAAKVNKDITNNSNIVKLDWDDRKYEILEHREEFSLCKKISTGEEFLLKNEFIIVEDGEYKLIDDYISLFINAKKGEFLKVIDYFGNYALVKYNGEIGWIEREYINKN